MQSAPERETGFPGKMSLKGKFGMRGIERCADGSGGSIRGAAGLRRRVTEPFEPVREICAAFSAGDSHAGASSRPVKCSRMIIGRALSSKWQSAASRTISRSSSIVSAP